MLAWLDELWAKVKNNRFMAGIIKVLIFLMILYGVYVLWYNYFRPPAQTSTMMTQAEAETSSGVMRAADNARVPISPAQADEAAKAIEQVADKEPDEVVRTTKEKLDRAVKAALDKSGGDFALVVPKDQGKTDAKEAPTVSLVLEKPDKSGQQEPAKDQPIVLNQYNVKAYPDDLRVGWIGFRSMGFAKLNKEHLPPVPLLLPKGGVGYIGPYIGIWHNGKFKIDRDSRVDAGLMVVF